MPAVLNREELHEDFYTEYPDQDLKTGSPRSTSSAHRAGRRTPRRRHDHPEEYQHDGTPHTPREFLEEMREEAHPDVVPATRRRIQRAHRDFRLTWTAGLCGAVLFSQLLMLLYVKGLASAAGHQSAKLDIQLTQSMYGKARANKKIAAMTSTAHLQVWAKQLGLHLATQADIDQVSPATRPADYGQATEGQVDSAQAATNKANKSQSVTGQPETGQSNGEQSDEVRSDAVQSDAIQPDAVQPSSHQLDSTPSVDNRAGHTRSEGSVQR